MKKYKIKIKGITPYMQKRMDDVKLEEWLPCSALHGFVLWCQVLQGEALHCFAFRKKY